MHRRCYSGSPLETPFEKLIGSDRTGAQASIPTVRTLVIPKVDHEDHLSHIEEGISRAIQHDHELILQRPGPLSIVASIESAQALWRIGEIARWESKYARLSALLVRLNLPLIGIFEGSRSL